EVGSVSRQHPLMLAKATFRIGLVVAQRKRQLVLLVADLHAPLGVDGVDRELIGVAIVAAAVGKRAGDRHDGPKRDLVAAAKRAPCSHKDGHEDCRRQCRNYESTTHGRPMYALIGRRQGYPESWANHIR